MSVKPEYVVKIAIDDLNNFAKETAKTASKELEEASQGLSSLKLDTKDTSSPTPGQNPNNNQRSGR